MGCVMNRPKIVTFSNCDNYDVNTLQTVRSKPLQNLTFHMRHLRK